MRKQININKPVGITKNGELVLVHYIFEHDANFRGATGAMLVGVTQDEIDERNDLETVKETWGYLWAEAVKDGLTTQSEDEYMQDMIDSAVRFGDGYYLGHDTSYIHEVSDEIKKMHYDGYETFECVSGGRIFPKKREDMMIIFDEDLFEAVNAVENDKDLPIEALEDLLQVKAVSNE